LREPGDIRYAVGGTTFLDVRRYGTLKAADELVEVSDCLMNEWPQSLMGPVTTDILL
jgi:hypothetical protein